MAGTLGMVLGKFMPPHQGHLTLVDFARGYADEVVVVVGSLAREPIPGALRVAWMRELAPRCQVVHHTAENPQYPHEHPDFWDLWRRSLLDVLPRAPDYVFAGEDYGGRLAAELGAVFVPFPRGLLQVSGTALRDDPMGNWAHLPRAVRPHFARRVSVFGPESTGKTTLARRLAERFDTVWVPEHARDVLELAGGEVRYAQMAGIARGQAAAEEALVRSANRLVICDTDPLATVIWSEVLFGRAPEGLAEAAAARRYDLTLLLAPDVPWAADPVRYLPEGGDDFFGRCQAALEAAGRRVVVVDGDWERRWRVAEVAVAALLTPPTRG